MSSEIITSAPFDTGDENERRIHSVPIDLPTMHSTHWTVNEKSAERIDAPEIIDLNFADMQEMAQVDKEQLELEAPIEAGAVESLRAHDEVVIERLTAVESFNGRSISRNEKVKQGSLELGEKIKTHALNKAEANKTQILEAQRVMIHRVNEAVRLALNAVESRAVAEMDNGESIQEVALRLYEASTEVLQQLGSLASQGKMVQQRSATKRDAAVEAKNTSIETMETLFAQVEQWREKIEEAQATIRDEHEVARLDVMHEESKINMTEDRVLKPLKPTVIAEMSRLLQLDAEDKFSDDAVFKDKMREVARQLAQPNSQADIDTSGITADVIRESAVIAEVDPDEWFFVQRQRQIVLDRKDLVYRLIDRENANIAEAQLHINTLAESIANLADERDRQHGLYKREEVEVGASIELHSTMLKDIAETVHHILNGDASSINEASILGKFRGMLDDEGNAPEDSIPGKLVGMLKLKRRLQILIQNVQDTGSDLPIVPHFELNTELPALEVDGKAAFNTVTEFGEATDEKSAILESMNIGNILPTKLPSKDELTQFIGRAIVNPTIRARGKILQYMSADALKKDNEEV